MLNRIAGLVQLSLKSLAISTLLLLVCACSEPVSTEHPPTSTPGETISSPAATTKPCDYTMGWDPWPPYQYMDENSDMKGLDVELIRTIMQQMNCKIAFKNGKWMELLDDLRNGDIDILAGASKNDDRAKFSYYSDTYRSENFSLYIRLEDTKKYQHNDLKALLNSGFKMGVVFDYIYGEEVSSLQDSDDFKNYFNEVSIGELNYPRLLDGSIDGFLEDPFVASNIIRQKDYKDLIAVHPLEIHSGNVYFMLSKKSLTESNLMDLNSALTSIRSNGQYDEIITKYLN